jgi:murein DD-endopeptidase MepM/ murein hydrolase activator NlpD
MTKTFLLSVAATFLALMGGGGYMLKRANRLSFSMLESTAPTVEVHTSRSLGASPREGDIIIKDSQSGILSFIVTLTQDGVPARELAKKELATPLYEEKIPFSLSARDLGLKEGKALLTVKVVDRSLWSNAFELRHEYSISYKKPRVDPLTIQHNGVQGGALLTFYKHLSDDIIKSGIKIGESFYLGYPASLLDSRFKDSSVFFSFYPLLQSAKIPEEKVTVIAENDSGNVTSVVVNQYLKSRSFPRADMKMSRTFFEEKEGELIPKFYNEAHKGPPPTIDGVSDAQIARQFPIVNEEYRAYLESKLRALLLSSEKSLLWQGVVFERPMPAKPTASFGERRKYFLGSEPAGGSTHNGIDLAQTAQTPVRASNRGKVVFADDLGIYGTTLILDHGFGLASLYGHLSSISVQVGDVIEKQGVIGRTGATGLAGGDHLHFEIRLHGEPVSPFEWIDPHWIQDHVTSQIEHALKVSAPSIP